MRTAFAAWLFLLLGCVAFAGVFDRLSSPAGVYRVEEQAPTSKTVTELDFRSDGSVYETVTTTYTFGRDTSPSQWRTAYRWESTFGVITLDKYSRDAPRYELRIDDGDLVEISGRFSKVKAN